MTTTKLRTRPTRSTQSHPQQKPISVGSDLISNSSTSLGKSVPPPSKPIPPSQQHEQSSPTSNKNQTTATITTHNHSAKPTPILNHEQQLTQLGNQLSSKLHQLATIYKTKATKYKAITTYQSLELEKRKIITTTSTMLKSETQSEKIQQIIGDSNALLFPMSLKQHYLKLHIAQIVNQEKELAVLRSDIGKLHQQFVSIESLLTHDVP
ncbi:hypothetical protein CANMA_003484 [Candida margitis]|uniref:uncharacterized protein n=1 Tax=Candida margitis TaxID=1775924 RepID=UPI0022270FFC|nr:uncharacterized protein CANMA_003484 [Candida margitis]KAI5964973.1 hypothetical protein CANMA_003484 [Candida margitis]